MNYKLQTGGGDRFTEVAKKAKEIATSQKVIVEFDFNEITCLVSDKTVLDWLERDYMNAHIMQWKTIGDDCKMMYDEDTEIELRSRQLKQAREEKKRNREYRIKENKERIAFKKIVKGVKLELSDKDGWKISRETNTDGYGKAALDYAEGWAQLMQIEIAKGKTISECYDYTQNGLGFLGITGFQFGCAVSILSQTWKYGEELRKVHNKKYGVSEDKKGTVNPAVLTISR